MHPRTGIVPALLVAAFLLPPPGLAQESPACRLCHSDAAMFRGHADSARFVVPAEVYERSVHGTLGMRCDACHEGKQEFPHPDGAGPVRCDACHSTIGEEYAGSLHGYAVARGSSRAPRCTSCHGTHDIRRSTDPASPSFHANITETCAACHGAGGLLTERRVKLAQTLESYAESVHGRAASRGVEEAAGCTDCHGVHALRGPADPQSRINRLNVASTCGRCHERILDEYTRSIHGLALDAGVMDSPTCNDCHGEHLILSPTDPEARTYASHQATDLCGACHADPDVISKYGLQGGVVGSYVDSYHGWATRRRGGRAVTCVSCHSAHLVLPKADPESTVHPSRVVETCGTCHENATPDFSRAYDHIAASVSSNRISRLIQVVYVVLIAIVIGGMLLHNLVILRYYLVRSRGRHLRSRSVLRFDQSWVVAHLLLTLSFVALVITGFALRYPDAFWARLLAGIGLTEEVRSVAHRVSGVVLLVTAVWHALYSILARRGRYDLKAMAPSWRDFRDLWINMRFHAGRTTRRAEFGKFGYVEKAEYWALVWGTILMALTGFVLWFPAASVRAFPWWIVTASQTIHFWEAWLAALAILVWHGFFVVLHPEVYPLSWTWLTGRMSEEEASHHHPAWRSEDAEPGRPLTESGADTPE